MTQDEIIEMARDSGMELYGLGKDRARFVHHLEAFAKLVAAKEREALAQTEQEPVAWMFQHDETGRMNYVSNDGVHNPTMFLEMNPRYALVCPLYAHSPQRTEPVGDDIASIIACRDMLDAQPVPPQRTEQEPVTWADYESNGMHHKPVAWMDADGNVSDNNDHKCFPIPLYTAPPQRTWVGLDHQDKKKFSSWLDSKTDDEVFTAIDDLLREMNT
jgi:hypothetical protein